MKMEMVFSPRTLRLLAAASVVQVSLLVACGIMLGGDYLLLCVFAVVVTACGGWRFYSRSKEAPG